MYFLTTKYPSHHSHLGTESHKSSSQPFSSFSSQISKGTKGSASLHIFFKIFPVFDFSDSSFGFRRNSGISKQISVPRWSSNLKVECCQMLPQEKPNPYFYFTNLPLLMICRPSYSVISGSFKYDCY